jgi:hypothetical protein
VHWSSHLCVVLASVRVSQMKAANPSGQVRSVPGRGTFRFSRHFAHPGGEERRIATLALDSPTLEARSKDLREVSPRWQRETKARHIRSAIVFARWGRQPLKKPVKLGIVHFNEISPVERIDAGLDLRAQRF